MEHDVDAARWAAVLARDPSPACGAFRYGMVTQGVYCRPGCPARAPLRRNVQFFQGVAEAEAAGFRGCLRCDPKGERAALHAAAVRAACNMIEGAEGVRARRLAEALQAGERVAEAVAGFGSESRVYERGAERFGMTPGAARRGGAGEVIRWALAKRALGPLMVGATEKGVCFLGFGEDEAGLPGDLMRRFPRARVVEAQAELAEAVRQAGGGLCGRAQWGAGVAVAPAGDGVPAAGVGGVARDPPGGDQDLFRFGGGDQASARPQDLHPARHCRHPQRPVHCRQRQPSPQRHFQLRRVVDRQPEAFRQFRRRRPGAVAPVSVTRSSRAMMAGVCSSSKHQARVTALSRTKLTARLRSLDP